MLPFWIRHPHRNSTNRKISRRKGRSGFCECKLANKWPRMDGARSIFFKDPCLMGMMGALHTPYAKTCWVHLSGDQPNTSEHQASIWLTAGSPCQPLSGPCHSWPRHKCGAPHLVVEPRCAWRTWDL